MSICDLGHMHMHICSYRCCSSDLPVLLGTAPHQLSALGQETSNANQVEKLRQRVRLWNIHLIIQATSRPLPKPNPCKQGKWWGE